MMEERTITGKTFDAMVRVLAASVAEAGSQRAWAAKHGFSQADVSRVLSGKVKHMPVPMANALGYLAQVVFVPARGGAQ